MRVGWWVLFVRSYPLNIRGGQTVNFTTYNVGRKQLNASVMLLIKRYGDERRVTSIDPSLCRRAIVVNPVVVSVCAHVI